MISISAIGLWLGNAAFTGRATEWLETGSGLVAIGIGSWMLWRRLFVKKLKNEHHHHATEPVHVTGKSLNGDIQIIETPLGERMRFSSRNDLIGQELFVEITRGHGIETLTLMRSPDDGKIFLSGEAPDEPHEFFARLILNQSAQPKEAFPFFIKEPEGQHHQDEHGHAHLDDAAHAAAHASTLPDYAKRGERPSVGQIIAFGAAGGMIPCPASITVMLLALSTGKAGLGVLTVLGFSLGLAGALVGIGVIIVSGLSKLSQTGRLFWITRHAPVASAGLVIVSGVFALLFAHKP